MVVVLLGLESHGRFAGGGWVGDPSRSIAAEEMRNGYHKANFCGKFSFRRPHHTHYGYIVQRWALCFFFRDWALCQIFVQGVFGQLGIV